MGGGTQSCLSADVAERLIKMTTLLVVLLVVHFIWHVFYVDDKIVKTLQLKRNCDVKFKHLQFIAVLPADGGVYAKKIPSQKKEAAAVKSKPKCAGDGYKEWWVEFPLTSCKLEKVLNANK